MIVRQVDARHFCRYPTALNSVTALGQKTVAKQLPGMTPQTAQGAHFASHLIDSPAHPHRMPTTVKRSISELSGKHVETPPMTHPKTPHAFLTHLPPRRPPAPPTPPMSRPYMSNPPSQTPGNRFCPHCTHTAVAQILHGSTSYSQVKASKHQMHETSCIIATALKHK